MLGLLFSGKLEMNLSSRAFEEGRRDSISLLPGIPGMTTE